jgi:hypothetical protein
MIPVETIPGVRGGRDKGQWWRGEFELIYLIYCKNFCKCSNVSPPSTIIKINVDSACEKSYSCVSWLSLLRQREIKYKKRIKILFWLIVFEVSVLHGCGRATAHIVVDRMPVLLTLFFSLLFHSGPQTMECCHAHARPILPLS